MDCPGGCAAVEEHQPARLLSTQSFIVRCWRVPKNGVVLRIFITYLCSLILGVLLLGLVIVRTVEEARTERASELTLNSNEAHAN